ncbi:TPA: hypothetical protein ACGU88_002843 [Vibrio vulnificus]|uniref:hypothetical protein n=2 Tax=Vibrio vulnificus TaxID=672 RepID=UPI001A289121|nr:hypothetical protein [Vibrio vulnificus]EKY4883144.1 hypothetical protein [Vibrio vulnificus]ELY1392745.1 hypothetical protein [Vibrio vulnificus]WNJ69349.1 hypothetical protein RI132_09585 [Vibrio vulnificus]HAS6097396.1 hypothetical protein [Vibrio vulnificus]
MVGFIGALSSSLCVIILVFITLLIGYIESMLPDTSLFRVDEITYRFPIKGYFVTENVRLDILDVIDDLKSRESFVVSKMYVGCTYGFDLSSDFVENISIYNGIKLNNFDLGIDAFISQEYPKKEFELNYCFLDFIKNGGGNG